jgi:salicylate hydroxylase
VLRRAVPAECIRLNTRCIGVGQDSDGTTLRFADGSTWHGDVVIGADGIHSTIRKTLFGADRPRFTGHICWRGLVPASALPAGLIEPDMTAWFGPHSTVVHYYVRRGELVNWIAQYESDWQEESWSVETDWRDAARAYADWNPLLGELFSRTERCYKWALHDRDPLPRWTQGRVTLLGDAAHPMLPYVAQGACMAIEDAYVIAARLDEWREHPERGLQDYESERLPRTARVQLTARERGKINHLTSPLARLRRDLGYRLKRLLKPKEHTYKIEWIYGHDVTAPRSPSSAAA